MNFEWDLSSYSSDSSEIIVEREYQNDFSDAEYYKMLYIDEKRKRKNLEKLNNNLKYEISQ